MDGEMEEPRLSCPLVWSKEIFPSRREVEQNYSHGLRRWVGYQRYLLQLDEGKSAHPFRQILEQMVRDAERQADVIDLKLSNTGDTPDGVLGRMNNYESTHYQPGREKLMMRIAEIRDNDHKTSRSHTKSEVTGRSIASDTEDVKEAWAKLNKHRTHHLAENINQFITCLESRQTCSGKDYQLDTLSTRPLKAALKKLYPLWRAEVEKQLVNASCQEQMNSECRCSSRSGMRIAPTPPPPHGTPPGVEERTVSKNARIENQRKGDGQDVLSGHDCVRAVRNPSSLTNFTVLPDIKRGKQKDTSTTAFPSCSLKQVMEMMSRASAKMAECRRTVSQRLPEDCLFPACKSRFPIVVKGGEPTVVNIRTSNPNTNQLTAENIRRFHSLQEHNIRADGLRSKLNDAKTSFRKVISGENKNSITKYPKLPAIASKRRPLKLAASQSSKFPVAQLTSTPVKQTHQPLLLPQSVSLYRFHRIEKKRKALQEVQEVKPVVKGITIRLPSPT